MVKFAAFVKFEGKFALLKFTREFLRRLNLALTSFAKFNPLKFEIFPADGGALSMP